MTTSWDGVVVGVAAGHLTHEYGICNRKDSVPLILLSVDTSRTSTAHAIDMHSATAVKMIMMLIRAELMILILYQ